MALESRVMYTGSGASDVNDPPPELDADMPVAMDQAIIQQTEAAQLAAGPATVPVAGGVPILHSDPSATAKIYIDFDGNPAFQWGSYAVPATPAYDQDGDPTTFNTAELASINEIWSRVAEKYSPFNIDVTTQDPGTYLNNQAVHIVVGGTGAWVGAVTGGVTYIGSFYNSADNTCFVFPGNLSNGYPKYVGEATAHEAGHAFGLQHQAEWNGTTLVQEYNPGNSATAPIMGNSYYAARGLWWSGTPVTNSAGTQSDLSVISSGTNGFGYRTDDYGNSIGTATALTMSSNTFTASGVIEQNTDRDYFSFSVGASGTMLINLGVAQYGAMLDGSLFVYNGSGALVASADTSSLGENLSISLTPGTYYVAAASHGGYGDIGQYTLSGSFNASSTTVADPSALTATPISASKVTLAWADNSNNETGFVVQRSSDGGNTWITLAMTAANITTYDDTSVTGATTYEYQVQAYNTFSTSGFTSVASATTVPLTPTGLTATAGSTTQVAIAWAGVTGATGYLLERSTDNATWSQIGSTTPDVANYADSGLSSGTQYYYRVRATSNAGNSAYATVASALTLPGTPAGLVTSSVAATQVTLSWGAVTGAASYQIDRSPNNSTWTALGTSVTAAYTDTGLTAGTHYYYRVRGVNPSGISANSTSLNVLTVPAAPTVLAVTATSATQISLSWQASTGASSYSIERSLDGSTWAQITTLSGTSYNNTGLTAGTTYYYRLRAVNTGGNSVYSSTYTVPTFPGVPVGTTATATSATQVAVSWGAVAGATSYAVERSIDGTNWSSLGSAATTTFNDTTASGGTTYYYHVSAVNTSGASAFGTSVSTLTLPAAPGTVGAAVTATQVTLTWGAVTGATSYTVEKSTDGTTWSGVGTPTVASYVDSGLASGTHYYYRVTAVDGTGASAHSGTTNALTLPATPGTPGAAVNSTTQVTVTWTGVTGAATYAVEQSTDNATWSQVASGAGTSLVDTGLSAGVQYYYRVRATNASGNSGYTTVATALTLPGAPTGMGDTTTATQVSLTWSAVTGAASYAIDRSADGTTWSSLGTATTANYTDTGLSASTHYFYRVRAVNASGNSAYGATVNALTVPVAVATVTATPGTGSVAVNWSAVTGATGYTIERSTDGTNWTQVGTTTTTATTLSDATVAAGVQYLYRVRANNAGGSSANSSSASALMAPAAPAELIVTPTGATSVTLSWAAVTGASTYEVEQSTDGTTWNSLGSTAGTSLDDTTLSSGTTYYFRIQTSNATGSSAYVTATNVLTQPVTPALVAVASVTVNQIGISWSVSAGATGYTIQRSSNGTTWNTVGTTGAGVANWVDTGVTAATHYYYHVNAENPSGTSAYSSTLSAETTTVAPSTPTVNGSVANHITVSWTAVAGATSYSVERTTDGTNWTVAGTSATTTLVDGGLSSGTTYTYRVRALDDGGYSGYGASANVITLPDEPDRLVVTGQSISVVNLSWTAVTGATSYSVERSGDGTNWSVLGTTATNSLTDTELASGTEYFYRVRASNASGVSGYAPQEEILTAPDCPATLVANPSAPTAVALQWMAVTGADEYEIQRSITGSNNWATIATVTDATFVDDTVDPVTAYSYRVRAVNSTAPSDYTAIASATTPPVPIVITAPSNVTFSGTTATGTTISWQDNSDNEEGFAVQRSDDGGVTWNTMVQTQADVTSYNDPTLTAGVTYEYRVEGVAQIWTSPLTDVASVTTQPGAPSGVTITAISSNRLDVSWQAVSGTTSYQVERSADGADGWAAVGTVQGTSFSDTGLSAGVRQYYRVSAINAGGTSDASAVATKVTIPTAPAFVVAQANLSGTVAVAWGPVDGAVSYVVDRSSDGGATWSQLVTTSGMVYLDTNVQPGVQYSYRARALGESGTSGYANAASALTLPGVPSGPAALTLQAGQINVSWNAVTGAGSYRVERSIDGVNWTMVGTTTLVSFTDTGLLPNAQYYYRVSATNSTGTSAASAVVNAETLQTAPAAPAGLTLSTVSGDTIMLNWQDTTGNESGFQVEYSTDGKTWKLAGNLGANVTSCQVTGLTTGQNYRFRVSGYNEMGLSKVSNAISGRPLGAKKGARAGLKALNVDNVKTTMVGLTKSLVPDAATGLTARAYSTSAVQLTWNDNADNELGYRIEYSLNGKTWVLAGYAGADQTGCRLTNLAKGKAYTFRVTAYNLAGDAKKAATAKVILPARVAATAKPSTEDDQDTTLNVLKVKNVAPGLMASSKAA
jgi:titin